MKTYDGEKGDKTNFKTDKYLKINSCGFQNTDKDYTVVRKKGRLDYHILLLNSGGCRALHSGDTYTMTAGNLIIYAPDEEQRYTFTSKSTTLWCHFTGRAAEEIMADAGLKSGVYEIKPRKEILNSFSELIQEFHTQGRGHFALPSLIELLYNIREALNSSREKRGYEAIAPVLGYINSNYNEDISLDTLAKITGYSKSRFSHIFSEAMGITPGQYQNELRLKLSLEMLLSTDCKVSEIALNCGFRDPLYYSRIFKKKYGIPPTEYRQKIMQN